MPTIEITKKQCLVLIDLLLEKKKQNEFDTCKKDLLQTLMEATGVISPALLDG